MPQLSASARDYVHGLAAGAVLGAGGADAAVALARLAAAWPVLSGSVRATIADLARLDIVRRSPPVSDDRTDGVSPSRGRGVFPPVDPAGRTAPLVRLEK